MDNKIFTEGLLTLDRKSPNGFVSAKPFSHIGKLVLFQMDSLSSVIGYLKKVVQYSLLAILALWLVFLSAGLLISVLGANLEQQKYASEKKIASNDFIQFACKTKSICNTYKNAKLSCMSDTNTTDCLAGKMQGADYSECTYDGGISGLNEKLTPDMVQCIGSKFASLIK